MHNVFEQLGFGGASLSSMSSQHAVKNLLNIAYENGLKHFDTAPLYGRGYSELLIGSFIRNKRQHVTITTKFGLGNTETGKLPPVLALPLNYWNKKLRGIKMPAPGGYEPQLLPHRIITKQYVESSLNRSLSRLGTDYIDYYLLHEGRPSFIHDDAMQYLMDMKQKGVVKFIGIATDAFNVQACSAEEINKIDVLQYSYDSAIAKRLRQQYPDKLHILHSCIHNISNESFPPEVSDADKAGYKLAKCAEENTNGKVLFSTRRSQVLMNNLAAYKKYIR